MEASDGGTTDTPMGSASAGDSGIGYAGSAAGGSHSGGTGSGGSGSGGSPTDGGRGGEPIAGQGGAATGGASGGAGAAGSVAVPDGCTYTNHLEGGLFCSVEMECAEERVLISCDVESDAWRCGCLRGDERTGPFFFGDATGLRTCEVAATACLDTDLLDVAQKCTLTDSASPGACEATRSCSRAHEIDSVAFETRSEWVASCDVCPGSEEACCYCADGDFPDYRVLASEIAESCLFLDELCRGSGELTPLGSKECSTWSQELTSGTYCSVGEGCTQPTELGDGTNVTMAANYYTSCGAAYGTNFEIVTLCRCTDDDGRDLLDVLYQDPEIALTHCTDTNRICAGLESLEPTGARECAEAEIETSEPEVYCQRQRRCLEPATIGGAQVNIVTGSDVYCSLQADGAWSCSCYDRVGNDDYVTVEVEAADSASACAEAVQACPVVPQGTF